MKSNYLLIHGSFGSPFVNWLPYLRKKIEEKGLEVYSSDFPTGVGYQTYDNWSKLLKSYVEANIKRLVLVCGFNNYFGIDEDYDTVNKSMYFDNLLDIENYCDDIICFYSDNDPYVKYEAEKEFANTITKNQIMIHNGGHLNSESGYTEFADLLNYL